MRDGQQQDMGSLLLCEPGEVVFHGVRFHQVRGIAFQSMAARVP